MEPIAQTVSPSLVCMAPVPSPCHDPEPPPRIHNPRTSAFTTTRTCSARYWPLPECTVAMAYTSCLRSQHSLDMNLLCRMQPMGWKKRSNSRGGSAGSRVRFALTALRMATVRH